MLEQTQDHQEIIERVAALDIGKATLVCCARLLGAGARRVQEVTTYSTMTRSLQVMADRLMDLGVTRVVMEATSDYWRPAFYLLEAHGFEVWLVNAKDVKHLPGRPKTDVLDALWLCKIAERQMIRPSFVPPLPIRRLRDLTRYRAALVSDRTGEKNRVEKKTAMPLAVSRGHARRRAMSRWHRGQPRPPWNHRRDRQPRRRPARLGRSHTGGDFQ